MMLKIVLVAIVAVLSQVHAGNEVPRVSLSKTKFKLSAGFTAIIEVKLDLPIICPSKSDCGVSLLIDNSHPEKVVIDQCQLTWGWDEWEEVRSIRVSAVQNFVNDGAFDVTLKTNAIISNSEYYSGFDPEDIVIEGESRPAGHCSGTGDPHYTTFDGKRWHVYWPGKYILYKSTSRVFEVQVATRLRPARHCGIAAREGDDVIVVDACGGLVKHRRNCGSQECKNGGFPKLSIRPNGGYRGDYYLEFKSGVFIRFHVAGHRYANVYVTGSSLDSGGNAVGVCGNFDGNAGNDAPIYRAHHAHEMKPTEEFIPQYDLFGWYPSSTPSVKPTLPPSAEICEYDPPIFRRPILNHPDAEDITDLLKEMMVNDDGTEGFDFDPEDEPQQPDVMTIVEATQICTPLITNSPIAQTCKQVLGDFNLDAFINDCALDLKMTGDKSFIEDAMEDMERECAERGIVDPETWEKTEDGELDEPSKQLQETLCPIHTDPKSNSDDLVICAGHGQCVEANCVCDEGFTGGDCSVDKSAPPKVTKIVRPHCDVTGDKYCDHEVPVVGENFFKTDDSKSLMCQFGDEEPTEALFLGTSQVLCQLPRTDFKDGNTHQRETLEVRVTTNGKDFGETDASFTFYHSVCDICNDDGTCTSNPDSCLINNECVLKHTSLLQNPCKRCQPELSVSDFTFYYGDPHECGPQFSERTFTKQIIGGLEPNVPFFTVEAFNDYVKNDPALKYTYSISNHDHFDINEKGEIFAKEHVPAKPPSGFDSLIQLKAVDQAGNEAIAQLVVEFLETITENIFPVDGYSFTIDEDAKVGDEVGRIEASGIAANEAEYAWVGVDENGHNMFSISATGVITVASELDFETNQAPIHMLAQLVKPQIFATTVVIQIGDVNEAPTDIMIDNTELAENSGVDAVVGTLTTEDPEGGSFEYSLINDDFKIVNDELIATKNFDFEKDATEYNLDITVKDDKDATFTKTIKIEITNVNEPPTNIQLGTTTFLENAKVNDLLTTVTAVDPDGDDYNCALAKTDNNRFTIVKDTVSKVQNLVLLKKLDHETEPEIEISIVCVDTGKPMEQSEAAPFKLTIDDAPDAPEDIIFTPSSGEAVPEDSPVSESAVVGTISATDYDADSSSISFEIVGESKFSLGTKTCGATAPVTCTVNVHVAQELNYELNPVEYITVVAKDNRDIASDEERLSVKIGDVNDAPRDIAFLDGESFPDDLQNGDVVTRFQALDDDDQSFTFTLDEPTDIFTVEMETQSRRRSSDVTSVGVLKVKDASKIDFMSTPEIEVTINVVEQRASGAISVPITKTLKVVDAPLRVWFINKEITATLSEDSTVGTTLDLMVTGNDMSTMEYDVSMINDGDGHFELNGNIASGLKLKLIKSLDYESHQLFLPTFRMIATPKSGSPSYIPPAFDSQLTLKVGDVDEGPIFIDENDVPKVDYTITVGDDEKVGETVYQFYAYDPENFNDIVEFYIPVENDNNKLNVFEMEEETGALKIKTIPSAAGMAVGEHTLRIGTLFGPMQTEINVKIVIIDGCHDDPCVNGVCQDAFGGYTCACAEGFGGDTCADVQESANPGLATGAVAGIVVGMLALIVLLAIIAFFIMASRKNTRDTFDEENGAVSTFNDNPTFKSPESDYAGAFQPGVANPMYQWYQPDMTRQDCTSFLEARPIGSFVVRDSKATPGWHMLGVRTAQNVVHEKIKLTEDGQYELVTSNPSAHKKFRDIPELVQHFSEPQREVTYVLRDSSMSNPMYGASQGQNTGYYDPNAFRNDPAAPAVPIKVSQRDAVATIANQQDDIYTNALEAKNAMSDV